MKVDHRQSPESGSGHQLQSRFSDRHERAFRAYDETRHVNGIRIEKLVEVIPGDPTLNPWVSLEDLIAATLPNSVETPVDVPLETGETTLGIEGISGCPSQIRSLSVRKDDRQSERVVYGLAPYDGVRAAGVVPQGPTHVSPIAGARIGREHEAGILDLIVHLVEDDAGLSTHPLFLDVYLQHLSHVLGEIDDNGVVDGLTGQASPSAARKNGDIVACCGSEYGDDILGRLWEYDGYRLDLVDARVGAVEQTRHAVGADLTV